MTTDQHDFTRGCRTAPGQSCRRGDAPPSHLGARTRLFYFHYLTGIACLAGLIGSSTVYAATQVLKSPEVFLQEAFGGRAPTPKVLWITGKLREDIQRILGHDLGVLRLRYWTRNARSAWILEETGKEQPITAGVIVDGGAVAQIEVLIYRESRGYEVRYPFFTDQFKGAAIRPDLRLDRSIDGISGATLSVRALTRIARLALRLDQEVQGKDGSR